MRLGAYTPLRNGASGSAWFQIENGSSGCEGSSTFAVQIDSLYFSDIAFYWSSSTSYSVQAGLDGSLQSCSTSSGVAVLTSSFGSHSARLECVGSGSSSGFELTGVKLNTQVIPYGSPSNSTLDDASSEVTYSAFSSISSSQSTIPSIKRGSFYQDTVSYTSSADASASFTFQGSAIYIFGMTGPEFGCFSISIDSTTIGTYNASTTIETYNTLLFFTTYLNASNEHTIKITNENDGMLLALDYFVAVQADTSSGSENTISGGTTTSSAKGSTATAVFGDGSTDGNQGPGGDSTATIIGGILGGLGALSVIWFCWAYWRWKKAGGQGGLFAAICGGRRKKPAPPPPSEPKQYPLWPMVLSRPKYAVG
ncbi:hypothetical protein C361_02020 [Cryptococcus neoformans Tu259-1]|uniref:Uncharacterized protein n=1 Tax=Cryptococcus neoformans Tu259-1 TaxID=1230072 RepID=A0A854QHE0_CRYNE|nr:hypothetical protein C353_06129 [Cryptococcus neoformans var. grubii AD1-83a]OXG25019.1 hypothetical protein C361_02020 [Cryptococcus neoformans var. grubii Tu259-1]OXG48188.1 hypothetical protein C354_06131 [Cryptococcus neoformans var. grubii MW-RSA1955]OXG51845.1 hypothetical protein C352_06133 [Cryptococcus neoformans var. grubii CHC193]OXG58257.1 hypothetical protein C351_06207 [Cryptococcus neoformans var. grubii c8]OXH14891.1 hypothetical protein C369_01845 [Cryptococcus neoformans v